MPTNWRSLERAIALTDQAFAQIRPMLRPTMTEREVAWELEKAMREAGADGLAFSIIVAAGPNGARPHARAGNDQLGIGRPIVMDFGAKVAGYHGDMTRTVILGAARRAVRNASTARYWPHSNMLHSTCGPGCRTSVAMRWHAT